MRWVLFAGACACVLAAAGCNERTSLALQLQVDTQSCGDEALTLPCPGEVGISIRNTQTNQIVAFSCDRFEGGADASAVDLGATIDFPDDVSLPPDDTFRAEAVFYSPATNLRCPPYDPNASAPIRATPRLHGSVDFVPNPSNPTVRLPLGCASKQLACDDPLRTGETFDARIYPASGVADPVLSPDSGARLFLGTLVESIRPETSLELHVMNEMRADGDHWTIELVDAFFHSRCAAVVAVLPGAEDIPFLTCFDSFFFSLFGNYVDPVTTRALLASIGATTVPPNGVVFTRITFNDGTPFPGAIVRPHPNGHYTIRYPNEAMDGLLTTDGTASHGWVIITPLLVPCCFTVIAEATIGDTYYIGSALGIGFARGLISPRRLQLIPTSAGAAP